jgi:hypothetical protein
MYMPFRQLGVSSRVSARPEVLEDYPLDHVKGDICIRSWCRPPSVVGATLNFDPAILQPDLMAAVEGDFLSSAGTTGWDRRSYPGRFVSTLQLGWDPAPGASAAAGVPRTVFSLSFTALTTGVSAITISYARLFDAENYFNWSRMDSFNYTPVDVNHGSVEAIVPTAVPEPSTIVLTMTGLGASWWRRRRARA